MRSLAFAAILITSGPALAAVDISTPRQSYGEWLRYCMPGVAPDIAAEKVQMIEVQKREAECFAFLRGVADGLFMYAGARNLPEPVCWPKEGITQKRVFLDILETAISPSADIEKVSASAFIAGAIMRKYPCP